MKGNIFPGQGVVWGKRASKKELPRIGRKKKISEVSSAMPLMRKGKGRKGRPQEEEVTERVNGKAPSGRT